MSGARENQIRSLQDLRDLLSGGTGRFYAGWSADAVAAIDSANRAAIAEPLTTTYVQPVPDHCDRITWRGRYFHLPIDQPYTSAACAYAAGFNACRRAQEEYINWCGYVELAMRKDSKVGSVSQSAAFVDANGDIIPNRKLQPWVELYTAENVPSILPKAWKHDCAALLTNDVELWVSRCPHCGKPRSEQ